MTPRSRFPEIQTCHFSVKIFDRKIFLSASSSAITHRRAPSHISLERPDWDLSKYAIISSIGRNASKFSRDTKLWLTFLENFSLTPEPSSSSFCRSLYYLSISIVLARIWKHPMRYTPDKIFLKEIFFCHLSYGRPTPFHSILVSYYIMAYSCLHNPYGFTPQVSSPSEMTLFVVSRYVSMVIVTIINLNK